jgi:multidrug efflux pump subunit AcrB
MNITAIALKNKWLFLSLLAVVLFSGITTFNDMPRDDMPPFLIRVVNIVSSFPGAGPERVEMLISDRIEKVVQEIPEVDFITSESRTGLSIVTVNIKESEFNLQPIFDRIRRKVESVQAQLPEGVVPNIKDELGDVFGILLGLTADGYSYSELKDIADDVRDGLIKLPDAAKVEIVGDQEERIYVEFDNARLAEMRLSKTQIQNVLAGTNIIFPGGDIRIADERVVLEPSGNFKSISDLEKIIIPTSINDEIVFLGDIANVRRGYVDPPASRVRINGEPGVVLGINLKKGGNIVKLGQQVDRQVNIYKEIYPIGVEFLRAASQDQIVDDSVQDFVGNLIQAVIVVLCTMLVFLGLRTGLVVASLIPSAIVMTIMIMAILDVGLNQVSLASLIIALGMLVDNAIVMAESMMVKMEGGESPVDAAIKSARELAAPLLVSSLTTAAAFLAFYLAESVMGEIMGQIFLVVSAALLSSWVLSLTIVPLMAVQLIKVKQKEDQTKAKKGIFDKFQNIYEEILKVNLRRPYILITAAVALFSVSLWGMSFLPFIFMPDSEKSIVSVNLELPIGTAIEKTDRVVAEIERFIRNNLMKGEDRPQGIMNWSSYVGKGAPKYDLGYSPPEANSYSAHILINTSSASINQAVIEKIDKFCVQNYPDLKAVVSLLKTGGASADPIAIRVKGKDPQKLYPIVDSIKSKLRQLAGTKNVGDNWGMRVKKIVINIDPTKAQLAGITNQDIALSLQTILTGTTIGDYREANKLIPIIMIDAEREKLDIEHLESLTITSQGSGANVPLKQVADIELSWQPAKILRRDLFRTMTVTAGLLHGVTAKEVTSTLLPWLEKESTSWPHGYTYALGGESEDSGKAMGAVADKLSLSFFIILLLLIGQFNSLKKPAIVMLTIPLGLIGVVGGLLVAGSYFGFMAFLGVISLAGIVINNAIVLLDRIKIEIEELNKEPGEAIIAAGVQRFRPILLTTATTSLGLIPLWIGGGLMWEPMAIGIIFGLLFATVLTLLFVPALYKVFFRVKL